LLHLTLPVLLLLLLVVVVVGCATTIARVKKTNKTNQEEEEASSKPTTRRAAPRRFGRTFATNPSTPARIPRRVTLHKKDPHIYSEWWNGGSV
jgi:hypothetical protein